MNYYKQGDAANADKIKAAFEAKGFIPRIAPIYYGSESVLFFTDEENYICETSSPWIINIIKTHPDYQELELPSKLKFKVGDWITDGNITIQIEDVRNNSYMYSDGVLFSTGTADKVYHLWTLADIKYGDVLANTAGCILIVKDNESCLCYIDKNGKFHANNNKWFFANFSDNVLTPATKEQRELLLYKMKESGYELNEKKQLHKIIEPKFKVGDSIVNDYCFGKVIEITNDAYLLDTGQGIPFSCEHNTHLWNIKDAKPGDVLANKNHILILKELDYDWYSNGYPYSVHAYCGIKPNGNFELGKENWCFCGTLYMHPATEEQRDLLFYKMKEAGYTWDVDKKELKKITKHYDIKNFHAGMPVLVRADNNCRWDYSVFSRITGNEDWPFAVCNGVSFTQCIPFEGNETLLGTTDMCNEQYINW